MYCDFYSINNREDSIPEFIQALILEIERCKVDTTNWELDTIFIGGGTPSLIKSEYMELIINALHKKHNLNKIKEFSIEVNPGEAPKNRLKEFKNLGINRLSIGVQSLEPSLLKFLTRIHNVKQVYDTFRHAREIGYTNINCDLIYSIPDQSWDIWKRDLQSIIKLDPEHISAYTLTSEKGTELFKLIKKHEIVMPKDERTADWFLKTHKILKTNNYNAYEISNFSKKHFECKHNLHYWKINPFIGYGPSAHSFDGHNRWSNIKSLDSYLKKVKSFKTTVSFSETLSLENKINEMIGFGLRTNLGISSRNIPNPLLDKFKTNLESALIKWGNHIYVNDDIIKLEAEGLAYGDAIAIDLMI
mgnify:CR=1 FL=1|jgi:oxygen-independent coproporphyrinogen III oxidase